MKYAGFVFIIVLAISCNTPASENAAPQSTETTTGIKDTLSTSLVKADTSDTVALDGTITPVSLDTDEKLPKEKLVEPKRKKEEKKGQLNPGLREALEKHKSKSGTPEANAGMGGGDGIGNGDPVYSYAEEMPEFPGGVPAMMEFIRKNTVYPKSIEESEEIFDTVNIEYVVEKDGSVSNVKALSKKDSEITKEYVRVFKTFPKHTPGKLKGKFERVKVTQKFHIDPQ